MTAGSQSRTITFNNAFKQFPFLEMLLVYDRSDRHISIYVSYNTEVAAAQIKPIKLQNASNTYSEFNTVKFDLENKEDRHTLHNTFTTWVTEGSIIALQRDYAYIKHTRNYQTTLSISPIQMSMCTSILDAAKVLQVNSKG